MNTKINIFCLAIFIMTCCVTFIYTACCYHKWENGYVADKWCISGLKEANIDYDEIEFIKTVSEDDVIGYVYKVYVYEDIEKNNINDIDIWHSKRKEYIVYEWFEKSNYFWNKVGYKISLEPLWKFERCLDFDIMIIE